ncbi:hypothetical protein BDZ89DRAFT_332697 [Hymenopellis radicata]|nr:hypothetical protein BDZ89DRAFT_332697 [Hymenopellis radicata]
MFRRKKRLLIFLILISLKSPEHPVWIPCEDAFGLAILDPNIEVDYSLLLSSSSTGRSMFPQKAQNACSTRVTCSSKLGNGASTHPVFSFGLLKKVSVPRDVMTRAVSCLCLTFPHVKTLYGAHGIEYEVFIEAQYSITREV